MSTQTKTNVRMTVDLPIQIHKKLKLAATLKGETMREYVMEILTESFNSEFQKTNSNSKTPNKETIQAIKESKNQENLKTYNSAEDFFNQMGI